MNDYGQIISFYSYKGGVGRSLAVANIGSLLAAWGRGPEDRVLLVDWDLEAPGLYAFFDEFSGSTPRGELGLLEYFEQLRATFKDSPAAYDEVLEDRSAIEKHVGLDTFVRSGVMKEMDLLCSTPKSRNYRSRVAEFDWAGFWSKYPAAVHAFRENLARRYRYVLIDSRTGYSDISGLCSAILPEKLVVVFALNRQNLEGSLDITRRSVDFRKRSDDIRPLVIYPLASRVDAESEIRDREIWLRRFEDRFEECFREIYDAPECRLGEYFRSTFIRHSPYYSYGEKLALLVEDISRAGGLRRAYEDFAIRLIASEYPWQPRSDWGESPRKTGVDAGQ